MRTPLSKEPPSLWPYTVWNTRPLPESGARSASVMIMPKQTLLRKGMTTSLGNLSATMGLMGELGAGSGVTVTPGASSEGWKSWKLKAPGHWPASQVAPELICMQPRTTPMTLSAGRMALTPVSSSLTLDRFSMHTSKVTLSRTSMALGFTSGGPRHDPPRHAPTDAAPDASQSSADANEERSMASWA